MIAACSQRLVHSVAFVILLLSGLTLSCGPGPRLISQRKHKKTSPFVLKQHVPNVSEYTLGASGQPDGPIKRGDPRFQDLVENHDSNVIFRDEERDGSDRIMSKRCKDKLEALAIKVMNQWPGSPPETPPVKVRVKEAWDDNLLHGETSLHYEGRAVDVATSDRDRSKLGTLARLAVEAGFDWVEYESHGHIHCSVQSDSSAAIKNGGCFNGESTVRLSDGKTRTMAEIQVGDHVMSMRSDGVIEYSEIIAFMDRDDNGYGLFYTLHTETGESITLTAKHLVYIVNQNMSLTIDRMDAVFAESVEEGQFLLIGERDSIRLSQVTAVTVETRRGIYAPLTKHGTIVVDDIVASCYAFIDNIVIAHAAFAPMRAYHDISQFLPSYTWSVDNNDTSVATPTGMHWYANVLYTVGRTLFSKDTLYVH